MSYQPQPPMGGGQPPVGSPPGQGAPPPGYQQPGYQQAGYQQPYQPQHLGMPTAATPPPAASGKTLQLAGLALGAIGLVVGIVMFVMSGSAEEDTIEKFARAPAGCTTTLEFDKRATFTLYVETKGTASPVEGDCAGNGGSYSRTDDDLPQVALKLVDAADQEVALSAATGPSYDAGGFAGQGIQRVQITAPGTYRLTVESADTNFAIAVGGAPDADSSTMKNTGIGIAAIGVVLGALLVFLASRKKAPPATAGGQPWQPGPGGGVPGAQPAAPQYQQPQYQQPPTYQQPAPQYPPQPQTPQPPPGQGWGAPQQ